MSSSNKEIEINFDYLASLKWHYVHRRFRTPFYVYNIFDGAAKHYNKKIKFAYEMPCLLDLDNELMFGKNNWDYLRKKAVSGINKNPKILMDVINISYSLNKEIEDLGESVRARKFSGKNSNGEMTEIFKKYLDKTSEFAAVMVFPLLFEEYLEIEINKELASIFKGNNLIKAKQLFTSSLKISSSQEEQIGLLKMAKKRIAGELERGDILKHIESYGWLKNVSLDGQIYNEAEIKEKIKAHSKDNPDRILKIIKQKRRKFLQDLEECKEKIKNNKKLSSYIETLQEAIFFRSWRTERIYKNITYFTNFLSVLSRRLKLKETNDIFFLTPPEILNSLNNCSLAEQKIIKERKKGFILYANGKVTKICSGRVVEDAKKKIKFLNHEKGRDESVFGQKAYPGKVKGKVSLILNKSDFSKMKQGNILVCRSTTPDYLPLIHKCSAIVTDEGGVLSHASIISRELHKPCVIGTKTATKLLKEGDRVEVDADRGMIKLM